MALDTDISLRGLTIYSVYVRSHTPEGTFLSIIPDLDRIRALGTDVIWFMPIHPIGVKGKKGSLGCPYANRDYRTVNPAYGTMEDFRRLTEEIHARGMKCMIDVVYNHTSPDSVLLEQHPDFFWRGPDGQVGNHYGDWSDVIDLDYRNPALWDYQIESLTMWAGIVDGFRCDVASFVPLEFWKRARQAVAAVKPDFIWLAESVHRSFGVMARRAGINAARDQDLFQAFDMEYEYDVREAFDAYLRGQDDLAHWLDLLCFQEEAYPMNYNKLRFLENHDQPRIASFVPGESDLINFTAMLYFLKGATLIYAGQEFRDAHQPSLFEKETIRRDPDRDISDLLRTLGRIKREDLDTDDDFSARCGDGRHIAVMERQNGRRRKLGVFSLRSEAGDVAVDLPDGTYDNRIDGGTVAVRNGLLHTDGRPVILSLEK